MQIDIGIMCVLNVWDTRTLFLLFPAAATSKRIAQLRIHSPVYGNGIPYARVRVCVLYTRAMQTKPIPEDYVLAWRACSTKIFKVGRTHARAHTA